MAQTARFRVDPKLAALLGEGYRSSEYALKELIDNAWDADVTELRFTLPDPRGGRGLTRARPEPTVRSRSLPPSCASP